jgi:phosphinothricin acetyltransferase
MGGGDRKFSRYAGVSEWIRLVLCLCLGRDRLREDWRVDFPMAITIRAMAEADWARVAEIWAEGLTTGHAGFEETPPDWPTFDSEHLEAGRLVALRGDEVVGWIALAPTSNRCVYAGLAELSVYVAAGARGDGVGLALLQAEFEASEAAGIWTLQSHVFPENEASVVLHGRAGFRLVGKRERLGKMTHGPFAGRWRDVLFFERRSAKAGTG